MLRVKDRKTFCSNEDQARHLTIILFKNWRQLLSSQPEMTPKMRFGVRLNSGFFQLGTQQMAPIFEKNNGQHDLTARLKGIDVFWKVHRSETEAAD